jgi:hypothetical protein
MDTTLNAVHHQANDWLRELDFYTDELKLLKERLTQVSAKNTHPDLKSNFGTYNKQLDALSQRIVQSTNDVSVREKVAEDMTKQNAGEDKNISLDDDVILREVKALIHDIADTRFTLNKFLAKVLK